MNGGKLFLVAVGSFVNHSGRSSMDVNPLPGGRLTTDNAPLRLVIQNAYGVRAFQVMGAPNWVESDRWDINAKANAKEEICAPPEMPSAPSVADQTTSKPCGHVAVMLSSKGDKLKGENVTTTELARVLGNIMDRPVVEKTGFKGTFDIDANRYQHSVLVARRGCRYCRWWWTGWRSGRRELWFRRRYIG
jgi:hypothetical protein